MELCNVFNPIAIEKPIRGREMRTTVIPKETIKAMTVVSTKQLQDEYLKLDSNEKEEYPEIYHEGYIDGKLYLVPDNNLQAMKDIVNRKMKRQQGRNKLQHSIDDNSKYNEFASKFDTLIEKIDQFAESSSEELNKADDKIKSQKKLKVPKTKNTNFNDVVYLHDKERDDQHLVRKSVSKDKSVTSKNGTTEFDFHSDIIPPLLDDKIKYKRVKPDSYVTEFENNTPPDSDQNYKQNVPGVSQFLDNEINDWNHPIKDPDSEIFRFLITGHFNSNSSPTFIIHQNYIGPNILENYTPDFKSHKKEGNVHIFMSGKFFNHDILVDETISSSAALSIPPYIIPINDNTIWQEKFKGVYDLGAVNIVLEGEFVKDNDTYQYTPIISMDIIKHEPLTNIIQETNIPTTVLYTKQTQKSPFKDQNEMRKHVHYAKTEHTDLEANGSTEGGRKISNWKTLKNVIKHVAAFNLLSTSKNNIDKCTVPNEKTTGNSSKENELIHSVMKMRKPIEFKQRFRGKGGQRRRHTILEEIKEDKLSEPKIISVPASLQKKISLEERQSIKKNSPVKKKKKVKKEDKNKAIVENPILAQMQEFFIT